MKGKRIRYAILSSLEFLNAVVFGYFLAIDIGNNSPKIRIAGSRINIMNIFNGINFSIERIYLFITSLK